MTTDDGIFEARIYVNCHCPSSIIHTMWSHWHIRRNENWLQHHIISFELKRLLLKWPYFTRKKRALKRPTLMNALMSRRNCLLVIEFKHFNTISWICWLNRLLIWIVYSSNQINCTLHFFFIQSEFRFGFLCLTIIFADVFLSFLSILQLWPKKASNVQMILASTHMKHHVINIGNVIIM